MENCTYMLYLKDMNNNQRIIATSDNREMIIDLTETYLKLVDIHSEEMNNQQIFLSVIKNDILRMELSELNDDPNCFLVDPIAYANEQLDIDKEIDKITSEYYNGYGYQLIEDILPE